jgi:branched-chain amino acid transport system ATP-binding protein
VTSETTPKSEDSPTATDASTTSTEPPLVELVGLVKSFGAFRAVDGVSLSFYSGKTVGIVGPNGAGKTTLFGMISGAHRVTSGRVKLKGVDITKLSSLRRAKSGITRTFQTARVFPGLTVKDHLLLARRGDDGKRMGWSKSRIAISEETNEQLRAIASEYGLLEVFDFQVLTLNQAHHKVLDLAMALLGNPDVLLLDEPTAGVALEDIENIASLLGDLRLRHPDMTIILTSHDADLVSRMCSRIVVLVRGQVLADGPTDEIVNDARVRDAYFGTVLDEE